MKNCIGENPTLATQQILATHRFHPHAVYAKQQRIKTKKQKKKRNLNYVYEFDCSICARKIFN